MKHWLVKQEPESYAFSQFVADKHTNWTGVRNFQARNFLCAMCKGDPVLYYHSGKEKAVVGTAEVVRAAFPDPTADEGDWSAVELRARDALEHPVTLAAMRAEPKLSKLLLLRHSRLSVVPMSAEEYEHILRLGDHAA